MDIFAPVEKRVVEVAPTFATPLRLAFNAVVGIALINLWNAGASQADNVMKLGFDVNEFGDNFSNSFVDFDMIKTETLDELVMVSLGTILARHLLLKGQP